MKKASRQSGTEFIQRYVMIYGAVVVCASLCAGAVSWYVIPMAYWWVHSLIQIVVGAIAVIVADRIVLKQFEQFVVLPLRELTQYVKRLYAGTSSQEFSSTPHRMAELSALGDALTTLNTKNARREQDTERLSKTRNQFLGNVSHELRTPVFAIQGYLETLLDGALEDESVRRMFVEKAQSNAARLSVLLGDLIDISRIESGEMRMSFRSFDISAVARESLQSLEGLANTKGVSTLLQAYDGLIAYGDKERIAQVFVNLISNAIKYNGSGGSVTVEIHKEAQFIRVAVSDTGMGIAEEHIPRLFERFYRVDSHRARDVGGTGLGLAIVKHILEAHDTTPTIRSTVGKGTRMEFSLRLG